jgi:hypothetical protein
VALAFSQRRESLPRHGAPPLLPIFFDVVLDTHHCRRHFRLAGKLDSNSRSLSSLGETFSQSLSKNENGGRDGGHFVGVTLAAFGLSRHRQERDCRDYDWTVGHRDGTTDRKFLSFMRSYPNLIPPLR